MALILLGGGVTDIRGSIAGTTFSRSMAGNYARARTKPVNPRSNLQNVRRAVLSQLSRYWSKTLTEAQRQAWREYSDATSWTNRLGQTVDIPGIAAMIRTNALKLLVGAALQPAAPTMSGQAGAIGFVFTATEDDQKIVLASVDAPWDVDTDDDYAIFFVGLPAAPGRITTPGLFNYGDEIEGDSVSPETFPYEFDSPFLFVEDQQITVSAVHLDELGRVSARTYQRVAADPT